MKKILLIDEWPLASEICASGIGSSLFKLCAISDLYKKKHKIDLITSKVKAALINSAIPS